MRDIILDSSKADSNGVINGIGINLLGEKNIYVKSYNIPYTFYNVNSNNNVFGIEENANPGNVFNITIPEGNYDVDALLQKIIDILNGNGSLSATYSKSYDSVTAKATLSSSGSFELSEPSGFSIISQMLKLKLNDGTNSSYTSQSVVNMIYNLRYIDVVSSDLSQVIDYEPVQGALPNTIFRIDLSHYNFGELIQRDSYTHDFLHGYFIYDKGFLNRMDVKLYGSDGNELDLNNFGFYITLREE